MKAFVDKDLCIGCELCTTICEEIFSMDDDGLSIAQDIEIPDELMESAEDARDSCPVEAISIE